MTVTAWLESPDLRVGHFAPADRGRRDTAWNGTPLGWAEYYLAERKDDDSQRRYGEIAAYLREWESK